jgi:hypothetical protein
LKSEVEKGARVVYFRPIAKAESYYVGTRNPPAALMRQLASNEAGTKMTLAPFLQDAKTGRRSNSC